MKVLKWNIDNVDQFLDKFVKTCETIITNQSENNTRRTTTTNCYQNLKGMLNHDVNDLKLLDHEEKKIYTELKEKFSNIIKFDKKKKSK
jgi:predicted transcriptional regulator YheO